MDFVAIVILLAGIAVAVAICSGNPLDWAREEWRLMRASHWGPGAEGMPGSGAVDKKKSKKLAAKQTALYKRMKKKGHHLYAGKRYHPVLTTPVAMASATPPKADKVVRPDFHNKDRRKNSAT